MRHIINNKTGMNVLRSHLIAKLSSLTLLILVTACGGTETWTLVELLTKGEQIDTATVTVDVRNCGVVERKTHDCSAGTSNDLRISLGGSTGAINASVSDGLGIGRGSGQSLSLDSPPEGFVYRYTISEEYRVAVGDIRARSSGGNERVTSYIFRASCSLRIESKERLACAAVEKPAPTQPPAIPTSPPVQPAQPTRTLCAATVTRAHVQNWAKVGSTDKATTQTYINEFRDKMIMGSGFVSGFIKGDTIPADTLIATDFGNGESEDYLSFPVNPIAHYRSWGLFEVTGSFVAPNADGGWCATIR